VDFLQDPNIVLLAASWEGADEHKMQRSFKFGMDNYRWAGLGWAGLWCVTGHRLHPARACVAPPPCNPAARGDLWHGKPQGAADMGPAT
jgi:hypothetical protein